MNVQNIQGSEQVSVDYLSALPPETLLHLFGFIPESYPSLSLVSREIHRVASIDRLDRLKAAFLGSGLSKDRWDAHLQHVTTRLQENQQEPNSGNILLALINYQLERFPANTFQVDSNHGYVKREMIIKKYNLYLLVKKDHPDCDEAKKEEKLDHCLNNFKKVYSFERLSGQGNFESIGLTEIPAETRLILWGYHKISFERNPISYIPKDCFKTPKSRPSWQPTTRLTFEKVAFGLSSDLMTVNRGLTPSKTPLESMRYFKRR